MTMAQTSIIDRAEWMPFFEQLTKDHDGELVTIERLDSEYGDQVAAERLPFAYAAYDPRDDAVMVAVGGSSARFPVMLRHMIWHPAQVAIAHDDAGGTVLRVVDRDDTVTLVGFHRAPALT
jgi:hypothetical protein